MRFLATPGWGPLSVVVGVSSPLLAEDPGCGSSPLLSGVRWWWWCVVPRQTWLRVLLVAVPRHSWLGPAGRGGGGGPFPWVWMGGFPCCECLWRGACAWGPCFCVFGFFVVSVLVVVWVVWGGCVFRVCWCACVCVCGVSVVCGCLSSPSLGWGLLLVFVWVWLVCVVGGPSQLLAEGPGCGSPPLLAGVRRLWWWLVPRNS